MAVNISSEVPIGRGLGSSGALSTALVAALFQVRDHVLPDKEVIKTAALKLETLFHGQTSGIDVEISTYGGTRAFLNGRSESIADPARGYHILLVDTGIPRDSKTMIARAKQAMTDMSVGQRNGVLAALELVSARLKKGEIRLEEAIEPFQHYLCSLGVSHPAIDGFIAVAKERLGFSAKITGAGGGGSLYALVPRSLDLPLVIEGLTEAIAKDDRTSPYNYSISIVQNTDKGVHIVQKESL